MKVLILLLITILTAQTHAENLGDNNCNIVLLEAKNFITGGYGNYYQASVVVSKNFVEPFGSNYGVLLQYERNNTVKTINSKEMISTANYIIFNFKLPFGATGRFSFIKLIPFLQTNTSRIYDNNFGQGSVTLASANNWQFSQSKCNIKF
ncbi:MAG: hypothetical protein J0M15_02280 [Deltaproteobacteria bacterium]|nr:hypothetical protein [Deltaproteobacteria bacterium]